MNILRLRLTFVFLLLTTILFLGCSKDKTIKDIVKEGKDLQSPDWREYPAFKDNLATIDADKIAEGNAVIAATKSGTVVWSWHIWVTPETLGTLTSIAGNSITYKVAPVNLGWVNSGTISWTGYEGRSLVFDQGYDFQAV